MNDDETKEEISRQFDTGPQPIDVAGIISRETAKRMCERLAEKRDTDIDSKRRIRDRFE